MRGLTEKQRRVFEFIKSQIIKDNRPPTLREIGEEFDWSSTGSVRDVLRALAKKGFIEQDARVSRGIRVKAGPGPIRGDIVALPVIGKVDPGTAVDAYQPSEEALKVDRRMVPEGDIFVVNVRDNSMAKAGVSDGDYVFVKRQPTCRPGQIVAVLVNNEVILREFRRKSGIIHLLPKNKRFKSVLLKQKEFKAALLGIMTSVLHRY